MRAKTINEDNFERGQDPMKGMRLGNTTIAILTREWERYGITPELDFAETENPGNYGYDDYEKYEQYSFYGKDKVETLSLEVLTDENGDRFWQYWNDATPIIYGDRSSMSPDHQEFPLPDPKDVLYYL